jgi:diguanylate cyclase (GGDEF)-like protein/PAS domain S-box-containing protein
MKASSKTKEQLINEIAALQLRISELEAMDREVGQAQRDFGERLGRYFPQINHMKEAIYVIFDRKYEFINDRFAEIFGVTQEEVCHPGFDPMLLVAQESRNFIREKYRKGSRGEFSADQYEFTGMAKDGGKVECETFVLFIPYKWGVAIHGILRNISVQKRIDEELQRHRGDLQIVLDSIPTSIFYTDREHRFTRANNAFCKSLGLPLEQVLGKTFMELFPNLPAEQLSHFFEVSDQVMSSGISKRGFVEILPSVRGRRWIQNDRMPYRDDAGNIDGVICLAIDISDLRETEEKLWYMSFHDVLTGLYNRTYFDEELSRLEKGRQYPISVVTVRVDDLLAANESEGIAAGNELLKRTAKILKIFRSEDVVARIGGDRFAALMPSSDPSIGENVLLRLRMNIEAYNEQHKGAPLNLSVGLATGEKGCSLFDLLTQAEAAVR